MQNVMLDDIDPQETQEWLDALDDILERDGNDRAHFIISKLSAQLGVATQLIKAGPAAFATDFINTISESEQPEYPGDLALESRLEALVRWNAAVIVARANKHDGTLGGHISSFASSCLLYEVGQNHIFKAYSDTKAGDLIFFQGHVSPGMYARSFLEGRFDKETLYHFRKECEGKGLSSYPHPWLMPDYWQFPTVSMGLAPLTAIYQARFMKYLQSRGLADTTGRKAWAFLGDGEMDEPESTGAITRAGREQLDNLVYVINCNLQRLDGLVNGDGKIVQELESTFRGAGWLVIKVLWGSNWQPLFDQDETGVLLKYLTQACDGDFQTYEARGGAYMREHFFGQDQALLKLVENLSDTDIEGLLRGGHDPKKVFAAFDRANKHTGTPIVILAHTVKGFGLGSVAESRNVAHNVKKLSADNLKGLRDHLKLPISDADVEAMEPYHPGESAEEIKYMHARRKQLNGYIPSRSEPKQVLNIPSYKEFAKRILAGTGPDREMSTTTAYVQILTALCKDKNIGRHVVPIVPDESRTFGMEGLFRQLGIYNANGQRYTPEDRQQVMYYKEATDGQILQEGINEAGAMSSWLAAATSYSVHHTPMLPFYIYYSMFGFQRIGDLAWLAGDMRARGFLIGGTSGRTTLNGEGLQHEDGHSHIQAGLIPNCITYDPTYAFELAVIIHAGLERMYGKAQEDVFYYITTMNENYAHPAMPEGKTVEQDILKGLYLLHPAAHPNHRSRSKLKHPMHVQLIGCGTALREVEAAAALLEKDFDITADVWSMPSANQLAREGQDVVRWNQLHPDKKPKVAHITQCLQNQVGPVVAATDYVKLYTEQLRHYIPKTYITLGTDGFGRSDSREALRAHFEIDRYYVVVAALSALAQDQVIPAKTVLQALKKYQLDADKINPLFA